MAFWNPTQSGGAGTVTSITIGTGLASTQSPLTTSGTLSVDQTFSPTWTGTHTWGSGNQHITVANTGMSVFDSGGKTLLQVGQAAAGFVLSTNASILFYNGQDIGNTAPDAIISRGAANTIDVYLTTSVVKWAQLVSSAVANDTGLILGYWTGAAVSLKRVVRDVTTGILSMP